VSLVERALQKVQAGEAARRQASKAHADLNIGKVVTGAGLPVAAAPEREPRYKSNRLVKVDRDAMRAAGLLPPREQEREIADQYRAIKRPLLEAAFSGEQPQGPPQKLIMVASALPGDGKTFTGVNLALSMALEKDRTVLLVDGDLVKPHISRLFGVENEPGLLDVLKDPQKDVESVILPTDIPGLSVLPAGSQSETATELLASDRMGQIVQQLSQLTSRGIVLFDSLPLLITSEARVLITLMGQIVLVVRAAVTPQQAVKDAVELIGDRKTWLVLNQAEVHGAMGYYYGSQYGYRKGYGQPERDAAQSSS
jgi:protein-tyrosine kinase